MFGFWNSDVILSARQISLEADFVPEGCGEADSVGQAVTVGVRNQCWIFPFFFLLFALTVGPRVCCEREREFNVALIPG